MISTKVKFIYDFFISLALLVAGSLFIYDLYQRVPNYNQLTRVYGIENLSEKEVLIELSKLELNDKALWEINPQDINEKVVVNNPLVNRIRYRRYLYPQKHIKAYVTENHPWASYGHKIIGDSGKLMADLHWEAARKLNPITRSNLQNIQKSLVKISSYSFIKPKNMIAIKSIVDVIEEAIGDRIIRINADSENNYSMYTDSYKIKIGPINKKTLNKVKRIRLIAPQIQKLKENSQADGVLDYVDLSLSTQEVILGQKTSS